MSLIEFFSEFKNCPRCHCPLTLHILPGNMQVENTRFIPHLDEERLIVDVETSKFVPGDSHGFFTIVLETGHVNASPGMNDYVSLYELDIMIRLFCENCVRNNESFYRELNLYYDNRESKFETRLWMDGFSVIQDSNVYTFTNCYQDNYSLAGIQEIFSSTRIPLTTLPILPLNKFNYENSRKLAHRIEAMRVLS